LTWIERRGFASLPLDSLFFPSIGLTTALFVYALARAQIGRRGTGRWMLLAGLLLTLMLATGTRTNLLFLLAPAIVALLSGQGLRSMLRLGGVMAGLVVMTLVLGFAVGQFTGVGGGSIGSRLLSVSNARSGSVAGQSWQMRMEQTQLAWQTFQEHTLIGSGLGHRFLYEDPFGYVSNNYYLDTPIIFLAKLGLVGLLVICMFVVAYWLVCRELRKAENTIPSTALASFLVIWMLTLPLGLPIEEKGFSLGLVFLVAIALVPMREREPLDQAPPPRGHLGSAAEPTHRARGQALGAAAGESA
jgi:hypothetical protein